MSLNWDLSRISNRNERCWETIKDGDHTVERMNPVTYALIWLMMFIGMSGITQANALKVYTRIRLWELATCARRHKDGKPLYITRADVWEHIGLRTNATRLTDAEYLRKLGQMMP